MNDKEILALEDQRFAAMVARDFSALEKVVHDELLYTHSSGERQVRFFGDTALIRGKAAIEAEIGGQPRSLKLLFLNAWVRTPQGWKFAAWQSCPQP